MSSWRLIPIASVLLAAVGIHASDDRDPQRGSSWWAYAPPTRPQAPEVRSQQWVRSPIDAFLLARLEEHGLEPAQEADRLALIRRATYDLTGLPPTPDEVDGFLDDPRPDAWERLVDRLLASPQYGERWGRHWLDLVRYAETDGYERDRVKPDAWKYRDYVIKSFNGDKPYDRFITEQLAGDEIDNPTFETVVATGYYRLGIWDDEPTDVLQAQFDDLDGIVDTTSRVMLGISMGCARCHDHKGDPIPQQDYYRMLAFFRGIKPYKEHAGNSRTDANVLKRIPTDLGNSDFDQRLQAYEDDRANLLARLAATRSGADNDVPEGTVAHWPFDGESLSGPPTEVAGDPKVVAGRIGNARRFDGTDDALRFERPVQDDFTITLWMRTTHDGHGGGFNWIAGAGLVDGEVGGVVPDFGISHHSNGRIAAGTGAPDTSIVSEPGYNDGNWHHIAFTRHRESGRITLRVDGELIGERTTTTEALTAPTHLTIGRQQTGGRFYAGDIDEIRMFDRVLEPHEILALCHDEVRLDADESQRRLINELALMRRPIRQKEQVLCVMEGGSTPPATHVLLRGNANVQGDEVKPGFPGVLGFPDPRIPEAPDGSHTSGRRQALADWITDPDNPLTARVMVNRIWQHHFGRGLVRSPNDFGRFGDKPTHPDLLNWLASEFVRQDWSIKSMHRIIMTSSAYRMSSQGSEHALGIDPANDLFWRFNMRRLGAEEIRDSILAVSGNLNLQQYGPPIYPPMPREVLETASRPEQAWGHSPPDQASRRSVYIHVKRSLLSPLLVSFDLADTDSTCPVRFSTTQPTQALTMLNSAFMNDQALIFAERLLREDNDRRDQVAHALRLATGRQATDAEIVESIALLDQFTDEHGVDPAEALRLFCLMVLNLNEFVFLD